MRSKLIIFSLMIFFQIVFWGCSENIDKNQEIRAELEELRKELELTKKMLSNISEIPTPRPIISTPKYDTNDKDPQNDQDIVIREEQNNTEDQVQQLSDPMNTLQEIDFNQNVFSSIIVSDKYNSDSYVMFQQFFCSIAKGKGKLFYLEFESNDNKKSNEIKFEICFENDKEVVTNKKILDSGDLITYQLEDKENYIMVSLMVQEIHKNKYDYNIDTVLESYNPNFLYFKDDPNVWANKFYLRDHYQTFYSVVSPEINNSKQIQSKLPNNVREGKNLQKVINFYKNYIYKNFPFYCADIYEIEYKFQTLKNEFNKPTFLVGLEDNARIYLEATQNIFIYNDMLFIFDVTSVDLEKTYLNINLENKEDMIYSQIKAIEDYWFSLNNINSIDELRPSIFECPLVQDGPFTYLEDLIEPTPTPAEHLMCEGKECWQGPGETWFGYDSEPAVENDCPSQRYDADGSCAQPAPAYNPPAPAPAPAYSPPPPSSPPPMMFP